MQFYGSLKELLFQTFLKRPGRSCNSHKVLSVPKKRSEGGIFFSLVEEAQVMNKISRIVSSYEDNDPIDTSVSRHAKLLMAVQKHIFTDSDISLVDSRAIQHMINEPQ